MFAYVIEKWKPCHNSRLAYVLKNESQGRALRALSLAFIISNTMTLGKLVIKCPQKPREDLWKGAFVEGDI